MRRYQEVLKRDESGPKLPRAALAKLDAMRDEQAAARGHAKALSGRVSEAVTVRRGIESEKAELTGEHAMGHLTRRRYNGPGRHTLTSGREMLAQIDQALEKQNVEIAALRAKQNTADEVAKAAARPLQAIEAWLEEHAGAEFQPDDPAPKLKRKTGEDWPTTAKRIRAELAELQAERHRVASAPMPAAEAKAAVRAEVETLAEAGTPDVGGCLEGGAIRWPTKTLTRSKDGPLVAWDVFDARALLAWLNRDRLIERLEAEVDALADDTEALTDAERAKEDARLRAEILRVEREEEAAIVTAAAEGIAIPRRRNADPRAVLELADNVPGHEEERF